MSKLDANKFNSNVTEEKAIEDHAYAIVSMMEASALFFAAYEGQGFPASTRADFEKGLKRCIGAVSSSIPNQWKAQVFALVDAAAQAEMNELDPPQESVQPAEPTQPTPT